MDDKQIAFKSIELRMQILENNFHEHEINPMHHRTQTKE